MVLIDTFAPPNFMNHPDRKTTNQSANQASTEIFRFPTRAELQQAKEPQQAKATAAEAQKKVVTTNYKKDDLSGCLSGSLKSSQKPVDQIKTVVTNYKDEDLSGCLSGHLQSRSTCQKANQRDRFVPTQRNIKTGEIHSTEADDLSAAIDSLNDGENGEQSGWIYFN